VINGSPNFSDAFPLHLWKGLHAWEAENPLQQHCQALQQVLGIIIFTSAAGRVFRDYRTCHPLQQLPRPAARRKQVHQNI